MPSPAALRKAGMLWEMHSRILCRMKKAVLRLTPHLSALSLRVSMSIWHSANAIQVARSSLVVESTLLVRAVYVRPQERHRRRCPPSRSRPFFTVRYDPQRGQGASSDSGPPASARSMSPSSMILFSDLSASRLSAGSIWARNCLARVATGSSMLAPP